MMLFIFSLQKKSLSGPEVDEIFKQHLFGEGSEMMQ